MLNARQANGSKKVSRIALLDMSTSEAGSETHKGVCDFAMSRNDWCVAGFDVNGDLGVKQRVRDWQPHGLIIHPVADNPDDWLELVEWNVPTVNVGVPISHPAFAQTQISPDSIAKTAYVHLMEVGIRHLGFLGSGPPSMVGRALDRLACNNDLSFHTFAMETDPVDLATDSADAFSAIRSWIEQLPTPIGLVAENDLLGMWLVRVCEALGMHVPNDVAVVGCTNSGLSATGPVPLTTVMMPYRTVGLEGATLLARLLAGEAIPNNQPVVVRAERIVQRETTSGAAINRGIAAALHFIDEHACRGIRVPDVLKTQSVSRVTFERRFAEQVGRTPAEEIRRVRRERAEKLLLETDLTATEVGRECGFTSNSKFSYFFKKETGFTPIEFRNGSQP